MSEKSPGCELEFQDIEDPRPILSFYIPDRKADAPPKMAWKKMLKDRHALYMDLMLEKGGIHDKLTVEASLDIAATLARKLDLREGGQELVSESLLQVFGQRPVNSRTMYMMAARIMGNRNILESGKAVPSWHYHRIPEWSLVEVIDISNMMDLFNIRVLVGSGTAAGMVIGHRLTARFAHHILKSIGYPRFKKFHASEVFGTCFFSVIGETQSRFGMKEFAAVPSQETFNRNLYKARHGGCPLGKTIECQDCLAGISTCFAAVHKPDYEIGDCAGGHRGIMVSGAKLCNKCEMALKMEKLNGRMKGRLPGEVG